MERNLLTVITPVTSMAGKLRDLEEWIRSAADYPILIILIHDFRDRETENELTEIAASFQNVLLLSGQFGSPGATRNAGLQYINTEWVTFWDSDDKPNIEKFMCMLEFGYGYDLVVGDYLELNLGNRKSFKAINPVEPMLSLICNPGIWRIAFKSKVLLGKEFQSFRMAEDQVFLCEILETEPRLIFFPDVVYGYHRGLSGQLTSNRQALSELMLAINYLEIGADDNHRSQKYTHYFLCNLQITGLKKGSGLVKFYAIRSIFRNLFQSKLKNSFKYASTLYRVLRLKLHRDV